MSDERTAINFKIVSFTYESLKLGRVLLIL